MQPAPSSSYGWVCTLSLEWSQLHLPHTLFPKALSMKFKTRVMSYVALCSSSSGSCPFQFYASHLCLHEQAEIAELRELSGGFPRAGHTFFTGVQSLLLVTSVTIQWAG